MCTTLSLNTRRRTVCVNYYCITTFLYFHYYTNIQTALIFKDRVVKIISCDYWDKYYIYIYITPGDSCSVGEYTVNDSQHFSVIVSNSQQQSVIVSIGQYYSSQ